MEQRDFQTAGQFCEMVTSKFPEFAEGWVAATEFFLRVANPHRALELIKNAITLNGRNTNWLLLQARCLVECGQNSEMLSLIT